MSRLHQDPKVNLRFQVSYATLCTMKRLLLIFVSLFLALYSLVVFADTPASASGNIRQYQIEMIIYSQLNKQSLSEEQWPLINPARASDVPAPANFVPISQYFLQNLASSVNGNSNYKLLLHTAWIQPLKQFGKKITVRIVGGQAYDNSGNPITIDPADVNALNPDVHWQVDGIITIRLTRFIDTTFNIIFAEPQGEISSLAPFGMQFYNIQNGFAYFQLYQNRRMKSRELNYIDYPLYGIIVEARQV